MARMSKEQYLANLHAEAMTQFDRIQSALRAERLQCLDDRRFYSIAGAQWEGPLGAQFEAGFAQFDAWKAEQDAIKATAKAALLTQLGITFHKNPMAIAPNWIAVHGDHTPIKPQDQLAGTGTSRDGEVLLWTCDECKAQGFNV